MASVNFYKYQGTGNDFVMIDNREGDLPQLSQTQIAHICHRRFGVGADGLILLQQKEGYDFHMLYYNSDGRESSMCGNGGRCIARFASDLGIGDRRNYHFLAIDGSHLAVVDEQTVALKMQEVNGIKSHAEDVELNTGSPHYLRFVEDVQAQDLISTARSIRYGDAFRESGINVNLVEHIGDSVLKMRTYERGVEDETYSCGTGVTAAVIGAHHRGLISSNSVEVETPGGQLQLKFSSEGNRYTDIWLIGPATYVFEGSLELND